MKSTPQNDTRLQGKNGALFRLTLYYKLKKKNHQHIKSGGKKKIGGPSSFTKRVTKTRHDKKIWVQGLAVFRKKSPVIFRGCLAKKAKCPRCLAKKAQSNFLGVNYRNHSHLCPGTKPDFLRHINEKKNPSLSSSSEECTDSHVYRSTHSEFHIHPHVSAAEIGRIFLAEHVQKSRAIGLNTAQPWCSILSLPSINVMDRRRDVCRCA